MFSVEAYEVSCFFCDCGEVEINSAREDFVQTDGVLEHGWRVDYWCPCCEAHRWHVILKP